MPMIYIMVGIRLKQTSLKYGTIVRLENMPSDHFSIAEPRKHFPSAPCERGYYGYLMPMIVHHLMQI